MQQRKSIFKKVAKDKQKYVRMKLSGLFIEEKPYEPPFNFNIEFSPFGNQTQTGIQLRTWIDEINKLVKIIKITVVKSGTIKRLSSQPHQNEP